ncbi:MAG: aminoglycoside 6-adenylyltransferase [Anaerolineae bacterium]
MRSEREMLDLILDTAREDDRIRAVILNGSRTSPSAPRDPFQDFDVVYLVTDVAPFRHNFDWIARFGELMILQMPEDMQDPPPRGNDGFVYLMQFADGNRIDLGLFPVARAGDLERESQSVLLLDKDGLVEPFPPASDADYYPTPPTAKAFADCCNEFWWVSPYVAKGLWRGEILYAKHFQDRFVRDQLRKMINWYVGVETEFGATPGKFGKYLERYLAPELWQLLLDTYSGAGYEETWQALFAMGDLFRRLALHVAAHFGFDYPHGDDERVSAHLRHVYHLPPDAQEIYKTC